MGAVLLLFAKWMPIHVIVPRYGMMSIVNLKDGVVPKTGECVSV